MTHPYWYVIFCNTEMIPNAGPFARFLCRLLNILLRPGFRHIFLTRPTGINGDWLVVNPHCGGVDIYELPARHHCTRLIRLSKAGKYRIVRVREEPRRGWRVRGIQCCTSVAAHILGDPPGLWLTPWRMYRYLRGKPGTVEITGSDIERTFFYSSDHTLRMGYSPHAFSKPGFSKIQTQSN
ncbi:MAG: hypothetical protein AAF442_08100 [Pseudomonadota bacterium]